MAKKTTQTQQAQKPKRNNSQITAKDCAHISFPDSKDDWDAVLQSFIYSFDQDAVFRFSSKTNQEDIDWEEDPFAYYDYQCRQWLAGRWIGETTFSCNKNKKEYQISVAPRFGVESLYPMFEEIFSINILDNKSEQQTKDANALLQILLPLIWSQKLGNANKYGIPRTTVDVLHKGQSVKGRLLVRKSILPFFREQSVVSATREKQVDKTICRIILQAYSILKKRFGHIRFSNMSDSAINAIENFEAANIPDKRITSGDYANIQYKAIYQSWKEVVDFSWRIIQQTMDFSQKKSDTKRGLSLFVDMAEIWEMYLRSLLKKRFPDWKVRSVEQSTIFTYNSTFFNRNVIPDIIMERGNDVVVFDAKWKKMTFDKKDVDRSDFFQIHTYIQYFQMLGKNVKAGGLLYPISKKEITDNQLNRNHSKNLFGLDATPTPFVVDGICFGSEDDANGGMDVKKYKEYFAERVNEFIGRIGKYLQ